MACCKYPPPPLKKYRDFQPKLTRVYGAPKFWARHDRDITEYTPRVKHFEDEIQRFRDYDARQQYVMPRYSNQEYGWHRGIKIDHLQRCDLRLLGHPCITASVKKIYNYRDRKMIDLKRYYLCKARYNDHWKIV